MLTKDMTREEAALVATAKTCWRTAGARRAFGADKHCCVSTVPGRWYWTLQLGNDSMTIGGQTVPLHTDITPCDEHLSEFERLFGKVTDR